MDDSRRRSLSLELGAVVAWMVLVSIASTGNGSRQPPDLRDAALMFGQAAVVFYILWNSGDSWSTFGIQRPRGSDLGLGIVAGLLLVLVAHMPYLLSYGKSLSSWHMPVFDRGGTTFSNACGLANMLAFALLEVGLYQCLMLSRIRELGCNPITALVASMCLFAFTGLCVGGGFGLIENAGASLVLGVVFLRTESAPAALLGYLTFDIVRHCVG